MSETNSNERKQKQSLDRSVKALKKEQRIFDRGYNAVRKMAADMVQNGATLADVLFHADQLWHEFKVGALGMSETAALVRSGMYLECCDRAFTNSIVRSYGRYAGGADEVRVAMYAAAYGREAADEDLAAD